MQVLRLIIVAFGLSILTFGVQVQSSALCDSNYVQNPFFIDSTVWNINTAWNCNPNGGGTACICCLQPPNNNWGFLMFSYEALGATVVKQTVNLPCSSHGYTFSIWVAADVLSTGNLFSAQAKFYDGSNTLVQTIGTASTHPMLLDFVKYTWRTSQDLSTAKSATIELSGHDGNGWAGNYGPKFANASLTANDCSAGYFYDQSSCTPCSAASCRPSQYLVGCGGVSNGTCASCAQCSTGQYLSGCGAKSNGTCLACNATCPSGYVLVGCGGLSHGDCVPCNATTCPAAQRGCPTASPEQCITRRISNPAATLRISFPSNVSIASITLWNDDPVSGAIAPPNDTLTGFSVHIGSETQAMTCCDVLPPAAVPASESASGPMTAFEARAVVCGAVGRTVAISLPSALATGWPGQAAVRLCISPLAGAVIKAPLPDTLLSVQVRRHPLSELTWMITAHYAGICHTNPDQCTFRLQGPIIRTGRPDTIEYCPRRWERLPLRQLCPPTWPRRRRETRTELSGILLFGRQRHSCNARSGVSIARSRRTRLGPRPVSCLRPLPAALASINYLTGAGIPSVSGSPPNSVCTLQWATGPVTAGLQSVTTGI